MDEETKQRLETLKAWIAGHLRGSKLPELLIEVDNELHFTGHFMLSAQSELWAAEQLYTILATIIAHGCNIGPYTMARLTDGITYRQIKEVTDWQLSEDAQRQALAQLVNAISRLDITQAWGEGKTSSSDGQRFRFRRKVLQRTYSHRLNDYALAFYLFVADNYAPFYSDIIECTDRDAPHVMDGLLYTGDDITFFLRLESKCLKLILVEANTSVRTRRLSSFASNATSKLCTKFTTLPCNSTETTPLACSLPYPLLAFIKKPPG